MWFHTLGLVATLAFVFLGTSRAADTQPSPAVYRIGWLTAGSPPTGPQPPFTEALRQGLRDLGYVEGQNLVIEQRWAEGKLERLPALVAELIRLNVDLLITQNTPATRAAQHATRTIPIVTIVADPIGAGFVASLARPGGNITGLTAMAETSQKLLELLKELVPTASRIAVLWNPADQSNAAQWRETQGAAKALGMTLHSLEARSAVEVEQVLAGMTRERADAIIVCGGYLTNQNRKQIVDMAAKNHLPAIYAFREFVEIGGLMSYGAYRPDLWRRAAVFVDKILKGANPADLPVERPMKFELVINRKTAEALGLTLPPTLPVFADEVIQ